MHLHETLRPEWHAIAGFFRSALLRLRFFTVPSSTAVLLCRWKHEEPRTRDAAAPQQRSGGDPGKQRTGKGAKHFSFYYATRLDEPGRYFFVGEWLKVSSRQGFPGFRSPRAPGCFAPRAP